MRTLLYGGRLIDPANRVDSQLNLLIEGGKVAAVCTGEPEADRRVDISGRVLCPGFIDVHVHEDPLGEDGLICLDEETSAFACMLRMGVTTVVAGNCGHNVCHPADYLDLVARFGAPVNVAMLAGYEYLRFLSGAADRYGPATKAQQRFIARELANCLERGCAGLSYGIRYTPGVDREELLRSAAVCGRAGKPIACHIRSDAEEVYAALEEFMGVIEELGACAQLSHIGSMAGFGQMSRFLALVDEYRYRGVDVLCDCYPYDAFSTRLGSATYDEGWRARYGCGYDVVELCQGKYKGRRCTEAIFNEVRRDDPGCMTVCHVMKPEEVALALRHPAVMLGSDTTLDRGQGHPRAAGAFPRLIAGYVRAGELSLYEAVNKMSAMPAQRFGMKTKGRLDPGADADLVVFDPERIRDRSDFAHPVLPPEGIDYVFVNGRLAAENCRVTDSRCGTALRF